MRNDVFVSAFRRFPDARSAADTRAAIRYGLDRREPLAVASAQQQRGEVLLTQNLVHRRQPDGVRIVNPFIVGPKQLDMS